MKNVRNAFKLYARASLNPFTIGFGLFMTVGMALAFIIDPDPVGSEEYISMIGAVGMGHIGALFMVMFGAFRINQNKFYAAANCARDIYTTAPIIMTLIVELIFDAVIAVAAGINLGITGVADVVFFNAVSGGLLLIVAAAINKKGLALLYIIPYFGFIGLTRIIKNCGKYDIGFGLSVWESLLLAVVIYALCAAFALIATRLWWRRGNRIAIKANVASDVFNRA